MKYQEKTQMKDRYQELSSLHTTSVLSVLYLCLRDAFIRWKITANYLCIVGVSMEHVKLLLSLLQAIINKPFVNFY